MPSLDPRKTAKEIIDLYASRQSTGKLRALVIGRKGVGKTTLARTCPGPVYIDMFDPQGEQVLYNDAGDLPTRYLVRDWSEGTAEAYQRWHNTFMALFKGGFFEAVGTYILDSTTTYSEALIQEVLRSSKMKSQKHGETMEIQDWGTVLDWVRRDMKQILSLPCNVIVLGHLKKDVDSVSGRISFSCMIQGSSDERLPIYFSEAFVMDAEQGSKGIERNLILRSTSSLYQCSTRLGRIGDNGTPRLADKEPADIKRLMEKAGLSPADLPDLV